MFFQPSLVGTASGPKIWGGTGIPILGLLWIKYCEGYATGWAIKFTMIVQSIYLNSIECPSKCKKTLGLLSLLIPNPLSLLFLPLPLFWL